MLQKAAEVFGTSFLVGFEVEFEMMKHSADRNDVFPHSVRLGRFAVSGLRDLSFALVENAFKILLDADPPLDVEAF